VSTGNRHTIATRLILAAIAAAAAFALAAAPALADPIADAKAQAAKVQAQVNALQDQAETAAEQYDHASETYDAVSAQAAVSAKTLKKVTAEKDKLQGTLDTRANALYREGPFGFLGVLLSARTLSDFDAAYQMLTNVSHKDAQTVDKLKDAKARATNVNDRLVAQRREAAQQKSAMAANKAAVNAKYAQSKQVLASANTQVQTLIAQQKAAEEAAARALAARIAAENARRLAEARRSYGSSGGGGGGSHGSSHYGPCPVSGIGAKAVWYAEKKLGDPYVWAASGPNEFDCSGLTMWAYRQVGISLPHYSREQINQGRRVNKSDLAPGDLVFFGSPIHHVGMYVGGGDFIEAPYSGCDVRITPLSHRHDFAGACRPYA
jgi:cell wall-associated NlpC family hydrolase